MRRAISYHIRSRAPDGAKKNLINGTKNHRLRNTTGPATPPMTHDHLSSVVRCFSILKQARGSCPFHILGFKRGDNEEIPYKEVKKAFLKLAMKHHPDTANNKDVSEEDPNYDASAFFHKIRSAFESLVEDERGNAITRPPEKEEEGLWKRKSDEEFNSWFKKETGHSFAFHLDEATMREVAEVTEGMAGGGLDRGGMWHLAKMVTQSVKDNDKRGGTGGLLQLSSGTIEEAKPSRLSRRRKRPT